MRSVDAMNRLQGWSDVSVLHYRDLAEFGEQMLLGIRFGAWTSVNDPDQAANWARYFRPRGAAVLPRVPGGYRAGRASARARPGGPRPEGGGPTGTRGGSSRRSSADHAHADHRRALSRGAR